MSTTLSNVAAALPGQRQSTLALFPPEITDCIFSHFDFDYSTQARLENRIERDDTLSNMSVIAEGWKGPARRILFRSRIIQSWADLTSEVGVWAGEEVRTMVFNVSGLDEMEDMEERTLANAVFKMIKNLPNLRTLRIQQIPFNSFDLFDSFSLRTTSFLPLLSELSSYTTPFPASVISDLLVTSKHQISRFTAHANSAGTRMPFQRSQLDFGGKLRYLKITRSAYGVMLDPARTSISSLGGLRELELWEIDGSTHENTTEFFSVVGATLDKLTIIGNLNAFVLESTPLLVRLTRLSLRYFLGDPTPLLLRLPASLSSLRLYGENGLHVVLHRWMANRSLVPVGLKHIHIERIEQHTTFGNLPKLDRLTTAYGAGLLRALTRLERGPFAFAILEVSFEWRDRNCVELMERECDRLKVEFRQIYEQWD